MSKRKRSNIDEYAVIKRIPYDGETKCIELNEMSRWVLRGEVSSVSSVRSCIVGKTEKSVLNFEMRDNTGVVRATAYSKLADKLQDKLQNGMNLQLNNFKIKAVNPAYHSTGNNDEIEVDERTGIREVIDCPAIDGQKSVNFTEFHDIRDLSTDTAINVVGVVKRISDIKEIPAKSTGKILLKRDVTLMDEKKNTCVVTMWNTDAEEWSYVPRDILTITGAGINEFYDFYTVKLYRTSNIVKDAANEKSLMFKGVLDELMPET